MRAIEAKLRRGMTQRGITGQAQEEVVRAITSFALYGFPESHAASFALIVYASAWLKRHHPAAFYIALLNAWPMGFYHPATVVKDAQRHGVEVLPVDLQHSGWRCRWEHGGARLGLRYVKGLRQAAGEAVEAARTAGPFADLADLGRRTRLGNEELSRLAHVGALASLGLTRREALWQVAEVGHRQGPLFECLPAETGSPLPEMSALEETVADYTGLHLTTGPHLMAHFRPTLAASGIVATADLASLPDGSQVRVAGAVIVRQRPGTAKGVVFITVEDETGLVQAIIRPELYRRHRSLIIGHAVLIIEGFLQKRNGTVSVRARSFQRLDVPAVTSSHDFY
jgi:error-prone DNA polymerase